MTFHRHSSVARRLAGAIKRLRFLVRMQHAIVCINLVWSIASPPPPWFGAKPWGDPRTHTPQSKLNAAVPSSVIHRTK